MLSASATYFYHVIFSFRFTRVQREIFCPSRIGYTVSGAMPAAIYRAARSPVPPPTSLSTLFTVLLLCVMGYRYFPFRSVY